MLKKIKLFTVISIITSMILFVFSSCEFFEILSPLDTEVESEIKSAYLEKLVEQSNDWNHLSTNDINLEYYGTYNEYIAVWLYINVVEVYTNSETEVLIDGISFFFDRKNVAEANLLLYKNMVFFDIQETYSNNLLTRKNLNDISYYNNKRSSFPKRTYVKPKNEKIIWNGTIDQDFCDKTIILVIDGSYVDWRFYASDFPGISIAKVESLMVYRLMNPRSHSVEKRENFCDIILIEISNPGKQNIINAIRELEKLEFVYAAEPNYFFTIEDTFQ